MYNWKIKEFGEAFENIRETFSSEGIIKFTYFLMLIKELDKKAKNGNRDALEIIKSFMQVSHLIDVAVKINTEKN